jgi:hypothetical protein
MGINHGRPDISMAEQLLHGANIIARFKQMGREAMTKRVTAGWLLNVSGANCPTDGLL